MIPRKAIQPKPERGSDRDAQAAALPPEWSAIATIRRARLRADDQPTLADRKRFGGDPKLLREMMLERRDPRLSRRFDEDAKQLVRQRRAFVSAAAAWAEVLPREVAEKTTFLRLSRGVLWVGVPDAAARFTLDRFLRSGCQTQFLRRTPANIRDVRVVIAAPIIAREPTNFAAGTERSTADLGSDWSGRNADADGDGDT